MLRTSPPRNSRYILPWQCLLLLLSSGGSRATKLTLRILPRFTRDQTLEREHAAAWKSGQHLTWSVADYVPQEFVQGALRGGKADTDRAYGYQSLGRLLSVEEEQWDSSWTQTDLWFLDQLRISPLRVHDEEMADVVIVPAVLAIHDIETQNAFIENITAFLPSLHKKPHIVFLNHAVAPYIQQGSQLFNHPNSKLLTFVSITQRFPQEPEYNLDHVVGTPYFGRTHWNRFSMASESQPVSLAQLETGRDKFVVASFGVRRYADRFAAHRDCLSRPELCEWFNFTNSEDSSLALNKLMASAWYVLQPSGDFLSRSAWYDGIMTVSIPVVFQARYPEYQPYNDVIDYSKMMVTLPEEEYLQEGSENIIDVLLKQHDGKKALEMLHYIHTVRHVFQFSLNPRHELLLWHRRDSRDMEDDAFTFTIKAVMRNLCERSAQASTSHAIDKHCRDKST